LYKNAASVTYLSVNPHLKVAHTGKNLFLLHWYC